MDYTKHFEFLDSFFIKNSCGLLEDKQYWRESDQKMRIKNYNRQDSFNNKLPENMVQNSMSLYL